MKKSIFISSLLISTLTYGQSSTTKMDEEVSAEASFGGQRCVGQTGLCVVGMGTASKGSQSKYLVRKLDDRRFEMIFNRKEMSKEEQTKITGKDLASLKSNSRFEVDYEIEISEEVLEALGMGKKAIFIAPGSYPMLIEKDRVVITFTIQKP